ncbi:membrane protein implicated in regulation of membrane protease activity [Aeromicrobium panaciterrae]|uniref:Membrane protein implicated in regulation of membrane protease activity n=1 Tax=Aeromicrobium panaciterrae TaxID=363861 RepID=A0ABU1UP56_9ACTN|nr:NfeD family protein [Aeromicrobium panaciterrae]MDR7086972.1 membrane protein implicated in regulation of membrane protease activity [Aeromicrobium panaciterrae]
MIDWIRDHAAASWIGVAVVLALVEMMSLDLVLLMFALGALAAAVAAGLGAPLWAAILVFALVSLGLLFFVRPPMVARLHAGPTLTTGHESLVGKTAVVAEPVDKHGGRVKLSGEIWSARADSESDSYETGTEVQVTRIDGATAVVTTKES